MEHGTSIGLYRTKWPALDMWLGFWFPPLPPELGVILKVQAPLLLLGDPALSTTRGDGARVGLRYPVAHASAHSLADEQLAGSPFFGRDERVTRRDGFDKIYEVSWLNVFGPKLVEPSAASACSPLRPTGWRRSPTAPSSW